MNRDEIYDHLAQVYLGKRKDADVKSKKQYDVWLLINIFIMVIIFASATYGLTAFLTQKRPELRSKVIYTLYQGPIQIMYNFRNSENPTKEFTLSVKNIDATKYKKLVFHARAREEGSPGIVKVVLSNRRNETAHFYIRGVDLKWKSYTIPFEDFKEITDWKGLQNISFVLESWNVEKDKGVVLIEDIEFSG